MQNFWDTSITKEDKTRNSHVTQTFQDKTSATAPDNNKSDNVEDLVQKSSKRVVR